MKIRTCAILMAFFTMIASVSALSAEPVRLALIETLSGPGAANGTWFANHVQWAVDQVNKAGGVLGGSRIEVVQFDSKSSPQQALVALGARRSRRVETRWTDD